MSYFGCWWAAIPVSAIREKQVRVRVGLGEGRFLQALPVGEVQVRGWMYEYGAKEEIWTRNRNLEM